MGRSGAIDMLDHVSLGSTDLARAEAFYDAGMPVLGLSRTLHVEEAVGYGAGITPLSLNRPADRKPATV